MGKIYMGVFYGYAAGNTSYGCYNVYFNYNSSGTTLTDMSISFEEYNNGNGYTTNSMNITGVTIAGQAMSFDNSNTKMGSPKLRSWSKAIYGSINVGSSSCNVAISTWRSGNVYQDFGCTVTGLATPPSGLWINPSAASETRINLSGGYSSNGGAYVTYAQYQYHVAGGGWTNCGGTLTGLSPNTTYYFRVGYGNAAGTSWSGEVACTTYNYPKPNSLNNITIGGQISTVIYNPLGRSITISFIDSGGTVLLSRTSTANGTHNYTPTDAEFDKFYACIPNAKSGSYYVRVTYGSSNKTFGNRTYSIKNNENPTFDSSYILNVVDTKNVTITGNNKKFISGHNMLSASIKPMIAKKSATGSKYSISSSGQSLEKTYSSSNIAFTMENVTNTELKVVASDSRGLTSQGAVALDIIPYNNPSITGYTLVRQDGTGKYGVWNVIGVYTNWSGLTKANSIQKVEWRYKENASGKTWSAWATITSSLTKNTNGVWELNITPNVQFDNTKEFLLQLRVTDLLEAVELFEMVLSTANAFIWKDLENKRVGINKKPDCALDVEGTIQASEDLKGKALYVNGVKMLWYE